MKISKARFKAEFKKLFRCLPCIEDDFYDLDSNVRKMTLTYNNVNQRNNSCNSQLAFGASIKKPSMAVADASGHVVYARSGSRVDSVDYSALARRGVLNNISSANNTVISNGGASKSEAKEEVSAASSHGGGTSSIRTLKQKNKYKYVTVMRNGGRGAVSTTTSGDSSSSLEDDDDDIDSPVRAANKSRKERRFFFHRSNSSRSSSSAASNNTNSPKISMLVANGGSRKMFRPADVPSRIDEV